MRSRLRLTLVITAALVAAVIVFLLATLPPRPRQAAWAGDPSVPARTVAGAYHVHTTRSDGSADRVEVARAASRAGLQFVIFTDHGDATRAPDPPAYVEGVLCLDGVEISTNGGHYVALDLPQAPYPLGGEAAAVIEDVARLGGFGIAAHVDSARPELAWPDWKLPFDGIEWISADSEWRNEPSPRLLRAFADYFVRPGPALASLLDRPVATLTKWDALTTRRPVVSLAGHDAHGGIGRGVEEGGWRGVPIPSYEASFRTFSTRALLDAPFSGNAAADGRRLLDAIRAGQVFTVVDGLAAPGYLHFRHDPGESLAVDASMPPGAQLVLLHAAGPVIGRELVVQNEGHYSLPSPDSRGAYRVEVRLPSAPGTPPVPWLVSNPISLMPAGAAGIQPAPVEAATVPEGLTWRAEHDPSSIISVATGDAGVEADYRLGSGTAASQFVAAAADLEGRLTSPGLTFDVVASRPMRLSVQLRFDAGGGGRWGISVFADGTPRPVTVAVSDLIPLDGQTTSAPDPSTARSLLLVVDLTNARPGDTGRFEVRRR